MAAWSRLQVESSWHHPGIILALAGHLQILRDIFPEGLQSHPDKLDPPGTHPNHILFGCGPGAIGNTSFMGISRHFHENSHLIHCLQPEPSKVP